MNSWSQFMNSGRNLFVGSRAARNLVFVFTLSFATISTTAWGQQVPDGGLVKVPPPPPPFVKAAPASATWEIKYDTAPSGKQKSVVEIDVSKSGDIRQEVSKWSDGSSSNVWYEKGVQLMENRNNPISHYVVAADPYEFFGNPTPAEIDFPNLMWLNQRNFIGKTQKAGHSCYYYRESTDFGPEEAWVDLTTGLPTAVNNVNGARTYLFAAGPASALTLPPDFQAAYVRHEGEAQSMQDARTKVPR
jgi:hypothetical protein